MRAYAMPFFADITMPMIFIICRQLRRAGSRFAAFAAIYAFDADDAFEFFFFRILTASRHFSLICLAAFFFFFAMLMFHARFRCHYFALMLPAIR